MHLEIHVVPGEYIIHPGEVRPELAVFVQVDERFFFVVQVRVDAGQAQLRAGVQGLYLQGYLEGGAGAFIIRLVEAQPAQLRINIRVLRVALKGPYHDAGGVVVAAGLLEAGGSVHQRARVVRGGVGERQVGGGGLQQVPFKVKFIGRPGAISGTGLK